MKTDMTQTEIIGLAGGIIVFGGAVIAVMFGILKWAGNKYLTNLEETTKAILDKLDSIENQINDLKIENKLQTAYIHEIEKWFNDRIIGIEKRLEGKRDKISKHDHRITELEKDQDKIKLFHSKNHPMDKL